MMICDVTLTAQEFKTIHNALCFACPKNFEKTIETIREALAGAYRQEKQDFDRKEDYYSRFKTENKLMAIWSIYELPVHGFLQAHPYPSDVFVVYGKGHVPVLGPTWGDIYRAADCAIRNNDYMNNIFIEGFRLKNGNELHMITGS